VDHILRDTAGDECHNVGAQHKCRTVLAKRSLGVITLLEGFVGPSDSTRAQRSRTGKQVFRVPWHLDARSPGCNLVSLAIFIITAMEGDALPRTGVEGGAMRHKRENKAMDGPLEAGTIYGGGSVLSTSLFHARAKERSG
jgi:hypothetical protein